MHRPAAASRRLMRSVSTGSVMVASWRPGDLRTTSGGWSSWGFANERGNVTDPVEPSLEADSMLRGEPCELLARGPTRKCMEHTPVLYSGPSPAATVNLDVEVRRGSR